MGKLFDLFLGQDSGTYKCFAAEGIFNNCDHFLQFLSTFFLASAYQVSTKQLFDKKSRIDLTGCMTKREYLETFAKIADTSLPPRHKRNRNLTPAGMVPFWMKLEEAFNIYSREFFIKDYPGDKMHTTLDDDKPHGQVTGYMAGLKLMRHVKDNVNGHTLHTLVYSYSQIPIQVTLVHTLKKR